MSETDDALTRTAPFTPPRPATIGDYRIVRQIGEGGMGVVYEAEQQNPRRLVALKVIRGGEFVRDEHIKLFQREAQALARLRHAGIAAIYETGRTADGQHFFAMELVRGVSLAEYLRPKPADPKHAGDLAVRLKLFQKICEAVNYAHQRSVIHRDLKPSNILVALETRASGSALPEIKILDFGLARITDVDVAVPTIVTDAGRIQGTWSYMSPEQARGNPDEIDLRSDVYSLGIILYELVTGRLPYHLEQTPAFDRARVICEVAPDPMRRRSETTARHHPKAIDRDLETIAFKAIEKEPARRYQTVAAFADDIERYLANQPILARPASTSYQLRKLVSRHKVPFAFSAALIISVLVGAIAMAVQSSRTARERDRAVAAEQRTAQEAEVANRVSTFLIDLFRVSDPNEARGNSITAREILDAASGRIEHELKDQPVVQARLMDTIGDVYGNLGLYRDALPLLEKALVIRRRTLGSEHADVAQSLLHIGDVRDLMGDRAGAEPVKRQALALRLKLFGAQTFAVTEAQNNLAVLLRRQETPEANAEAETLLRSALATRRKLFGDTHRDVAQNLLNLGMLLYANKRDFAAAEPLFREALAINRKVLGEEHDEVGISLNNLALLLRDQNRLDEAESLFRQALTIGRKILGDSHPEVGSYAINLASVVQRKGDYRQAETLYRAALEVDRKHFPERHWRVATTKNLLGSCLTAEGRYREAEMLLLEAYPIIRDEWGGSHPRTAAVLRRIAALYDAWGKPQPAARYRALIPTR